MNMPLTEIPLGQKCTITSINDTGTFGQRIRNIGLIPGKDIIVQGEAPLGDPIQIKLKGHSISIRKKEAEKIIVRI